jgi:hypothetical protein
MTHDSLIITTLFDSPSGDSVSNQYYREVLLHALKKILPSEFFDAYESIEGRTKHQKELLQQLIPLISCSEARSFPGTLSFYALSKYRQSSFKFFFEMISRWLTPGRRLNVVLVYASDFRLTSLSEEIYTVCEVMISVVDQSEFAEIQHNFPIIGSEIALGMDSDFYAQRIMEVKGLTSDDKTALIQGFIAYLVKRFPRYYDHDVFTEMQHVLVACKDGFKADRNARHLSRIISLQYLFRKLLRDAVLKNCEKRHLHLKVFNSVVRTDKGRKKVLSILVGVNFLREQENLSEKHLLKAIEHTIPTVVLVENSFWLNKLSSENICIAYIEVVKKEGENFNAQEIRSLRRDLSGNIKNRIEHRLHDIFMPRNEEEVMRNIVTLTNQIKYVRDIPQVMINFDEQAHAHMYFTIIMARLLKNDMLPICELYKKNASRLEYLHDRSKIMGFVRKKYAKEASVFRVKLPKEGFLRADHSIDLYKARQLIVQELSNVFGEIRDYNGGMISKQTELFSTIRAMLNFVGELDELLLENFFYSLSPVVVRALMDPQAFCTLFLMLLESLPLYRHEDHCFMKVHRESYNDFILVILDDLLVKEEIHQKVQDLEIPSTELAYTLIKFQGVHCMGYICCAHEGNLKEKLIEVIREGVKVVEQESMLSLVQGRGH